MHVPILKLLASSYTRRNVRNVEELPLGHKTVYQIFERGL